MSSRVKRKQRLASGSWWDRPDLEIRETVGEDFRIAVDKAIYEFIHNGSLQDYSFEPHLTSDERKYIHIRAGVYSLMSRSHGKEPNRVITIYKKKVKSNFEAFTVSLSRKSQWELTTLEKLYQENERVSSYTMPSENKIFGKLLLGPPPEVQQAFPSPQIRYFREHLPIFEKQDFVMHKIRNNQVLIISSETGSGKTTQIPQYIMDDAALRGESCRIICTQPRRISTVAVAERVAHERGSEVGDAVGYHIRLESKLGSKCNLIYCTNGVLIRSLMSGDAVLESLTHIIIDEVHERDKLSDFLLICVRECLRKGANIKLILMSATMNVAKFVSYFDHAELLEIPGRLFSIQQYFLAEILEMTGFDAVVHERTDKIVKCKRQLIVDTFQVYEPNPLFDEAIVQCLSTSDGPESSGVWAQVIYYIMSGDMPVDYRNSESGMTALVAAVCRKNIDEVERLCGLQADLNIATNTGKTALSLAEELGYEEIRNVLLAASNPPHPQEQLLEKYNMLFLDDEINYELLTHLILTICTQYSQGAILVFLPGYDDIMTCFENIKRSRLSESQYKVFFLHGSMNIKDQKGIFKPLADVRKIILSTNIAETSLTIDDVVYVIDCGRAKVQTYESISGLSSLQTQWISKACVKQRAGRAGRTRSGLCFHLFSSKRYASLLDERIPEILRVPLEELCLNTKTLAGQRSSIYEFLVMAPDPPSSHAVKTAIENLEVLGALDKDERLTYLGEYLSQLTIEPHLGKMLVLGVFLKCIDPILTIVSSLAQKDYFQLPTNSEARGIAIERRNKLKMCTYSDHIVHLMAFIYWQDGVHSRKGNDFCKEHFISSSSMDMILKTRSQLLTQMRAARFVAPAGNVMQELNANSANWALIKGVIASGLYPKFAFKKSAYFCTRTEKKVLPHNSHQLLKDLIPVWLVYDEMFKSRYGHQIRGVSPVTPITIALMCGTKVTLPADDTTQKSMEIDNWLEFEFPTPQVIKLRQYVDSYINRKLQNPLNVATKSDELALVILGNVLEIEDRNLGLPWPDGIEQRPKFTTYNIIHDTQYDNNWRGGGGDGITIQRPIVGRPYQCESLRNQNRRFVPAKNVYPMRRQDAVGSSVGFSNNGVPNWRQRNGVSNHVGNGSNNFNVIHQDLPSLDKLSIAQTSCTALLDSLQPEQVPVGCSLALPLLPNLENSIFLLIRVKQESSILIAYEAERWTFSPQTEKLVLSLDNGGTCVYLLYTVPTMHTFYGIAKFLGIEPVRSKLQARIEWIFKGSVPYKSVNHLRNLYNGNRLISEGTDGQEIEKGAAMKLWDLFADNLRCRP